LPQVSISTAAEELAISSIQTLKIPSHRAEIALLEAARARVAADNRLEVTTEDIAKIAPLALRQRRSLHLESYAAAIAIEDATIVEALAQVGAAAANGRTPRKRVGRAKAGETVKG
jgi:magnesium chelatase subunit I